MLRIVILVIVAMPAWSQVCNPNEILGAFGFQLSGMSNVAGAPSPAASIGRIELDAEGKVKGVSSVNFSGNFLGNPVTGTYETKVDCAFTMKLQDDSGGWQQFAGKVRPGGATVDFKQVGAGGGTAGLMQKISGNCGPEVFRGHYLLSLSGVGSSTVREAAVEADGAGGLRLTWNRGSSTGSYQPDEGCFFVIEFGAVTGEPVKLRGIVVNGGSEVFAVATDPKVVGTARFRR